jgi:hypothetical protein
MLKVFLSLIALYLAVGHYWSSCLRFFTLVVVAFLAFIILFVCASLIYYPLSSALSASYILIDATCVCGPWTDLTWRTRNSRSLVFAPFHSNTTARVSSRSQPVTWDSELLRNAFPMKSRNTQLPLKNADVSVLRSYLLNAIRYSNKLLLTNSSILIFIWLYHFDMIFICSSAKEE